MKLVEMVVSTDLHRARFPPTVHASELNLAIVRVRAKMELLHTLVQAFLENESKRPAVSVEPHSTLHDVLAIAEDKNHGRGLQNFEVVHKYVLEKGPQARGFHPLFTDPFKLPRFLNAMYGQ